MLIFIVFIALFFSFFNHKIQENLFINNRNQKIIIEFPSFIINLKETDEGKRRLPIIKSIFPNAKRFPATYGKTFDFKPYIDLVRRRHNKIHQDHLHMLNIMELNSGIRLKEKVSSKSKRLSGTLKKKSFTKSSN